MLQHVAESLNEVFYTYELHADGSVTTVFEVGTAWRAMIGGDPGNRDPDRLWEERIHPDDRPAWQALDQRIRNGETVELEYRLRGLDGAERWVWARERPRRGPAGEVLVDGTMSDVTARKRAELALGDALARADRMARVDALTGAFNRRHMGEAIEAELHRATRTGETPALLLLDVDHFKRINDDHGHAAGDEVLRELTTRLQGAIRGYDTLARWGGEEYAVLVPAIAGLPDLRAIGESIRRAAEDVPFVIGGAMLRVTLSVGATRADGAWGIDELLARADRALYAAKRHGRNRVELCEELADDVAGEDEDSEGLRMAQALALASTVREGEAPRHAEHVAALASATAQELELAPEVIRRCRLAGWLHDVGMVAIPDAILGKPGILDEDEWRVMQTHPEVGERILRRIPALTTAARGVRHHHERFDGTGYPDRLIGNRIPVEARIVAVVDAYSAMVVSRAHRDATTPAQAITAVRRGAGSQFDPAVVEALAAVLLRGELAETELLETG